MFRSRAVPVLMYHHVSPVPGHINVSPEHFEDQLAWLKKHGYQSLTSSAFASHLSGRGAPQKSVLITFDDGYLDNYVYAYPLLRKYGFQAMIFLVTSWIGDGPLRRHSGQGAVPGVLNHSESMKRVAQGQFDDVALRWSEVQLMRADGVCEFHSHTHTHTRWDKSPQAAHKNERMAEELALSRSSLQTHLGEVSEHFCWPQGYFDPDYVGIARDAGFRYLYTTQAFGQNRPGADPGHIYRFAVRDTTGASVGRRVMVARHPLISPVFNHWKLWTRRIRGRS